MFFSISIQTTTDYSSPGVRVRASKDLEELRLPQNLSLAEGLLETRIEYIDVQVVVCRSVLSHI
jgi:hypothetical protein